jgi:predicted PurR-regulated permease PerM
VKYFKSQLILASLAFVVMFIALQIYGLFFEMKYIFLIALSLMIIDFLPILGTSAILIPWAGYAILMEGDIVKGVFLLALAAGFFVLRRLVEPKILGSQTGLHPIVALMSIYIGLRLAGVWGAILGPVLVIMAIGVYNSRVFDNTIQDLKDLGIDLGGLFHRRDLPVESPAVFEKSDE